MSNTSIEWNAVNCVLLAVSELRGTKKEAYRDEIKRLAIKHSQELGVTDAAIDAALDQVISTKLDVK